MVVEGFTVSGKLRFVTVSKSLEPNFQRFRGALGSFCLLWVGLGVGWIFNEFQDPRMLLLC